MIKRLSIIGLAILLLSCNRLPTAPTPPQAPNSVTNNNCIGAGSCSGTGGIGGSPTTSVCQQITRVEVKILFDGQRTTLVVGERVTLDATAFTGGAGGGQVFETCSIAWAVAPQEVCSLEGDLGTYTPKMRTIKAGTCIASAAVGSGAGARTFFVQ